jgi:Tfp pilus assembly protein PilV
MFFAMERATRSSSIGLLSFVRYQYSSSPAKNALRQGTVVAGWLALQDRINCGTTQLPNEKQKAR